MKPGPPPYPRLVPDVDCDEDIILSGAIVYTGGIDDADEGVEQLAEQRAAKRRRIEEHAQAYLRGDGLFILSAGLRGPFDESWRNPWAEPRRKRKRGHGVESKAMKKANIAADPKKAEGCSRRIAEPATITPIRVSTPLNNPFDKPLASSAAPKSNEKVEDWLRRNSALPQQKSFVAPVSPTPKAKSSPIISTKGRNWTPTKQLISVGSQEVRAPVHQLNTQAKASFNTLAPVAKHSACPEDAHSRLQNALRSETRHIATSLVLPKSMSSSPIRHNDRAEAEIARMKRSAVELKDLTITNHYRSPLYGEVLRPAPLASTTNEPDANKLVTPPVSDQEQENRPAHQSRNPQERLKATKVAPFDGQQQVNKPISSDKRSEGTGEEQRSAAPDVTSSRVKLKTPEALVEEEIRRGEDHTSATQQPKADAGDLDIDICRPPIPSTAVTDVASTNLPPSAQQKPELQTMTSITSSSIKLLEPVTTGINISAASCTGEPDNHNCGVAEPVAVATSLKRPREDNLSAEAVVQENNPKAHPDNAERIEILAFNFDVAQAAEALKQTDNDLVHVASEQDRRPKRTSETSMQLLIAASPQSVKKQRSAKRPKKASFATEPSSLSSNGSIKSVLRVQKAGASPQPTSTTSKRLRSPPPSFPKLDLDMDTSNEDENSVHSGPVKQAHSPLRNNTSQVTKSARRGILKNNNAASSSAVALASAAPSSKLGRDVPSASGQNGVFPAVNEEEFDLAGAIDDLGSFLSTWDAEKDGLQVV